MSKKNPQAKAAKPKTTAMVVYKQGSTQKDQSQDRRITILVKAIGTLQHEINEVRKQFNKLVVEVKSHGGAKLSGPLQAFVDQFLNVEDSVRKQIFRRLPDDSAIPARIDWQVTEVTIVMDANGRCAVRGDACVRYPLVTFVADFSGAATNVTGSRYATLSGQYNYSRVIGHCIKSEPLAALPQGTTRVAPFWSYDVEAKNAPTDYASLGNKTGWKSMQGRARFCLQPRPSTVSKMSTWGDITTARASDQNWGAYLIWDGCGNAYTYKITSFQILEVIVKDDAKLDSRVPAPDLEKLTQRINRAPFVKWEESVNVVSGVQVAAAARR